jgi:hypothetical protein
MGSPDDAGRITMKRDARLAGLSSDHHQALVLARRVESGTLSATEVRARFENELAPHFAVEEEVLLPALRAMGAGALAERTAGEHAGIRDALSRAEAGDAAALAELAALLIAHVRFEERDLFPACEARLAASVLEAVSHRRPRGK